MFRERRDDTGMLVDLPGDFLLPVFMGAVQ